MCEAFSPLLAHPELVVEAMTPCRGVGSAVGDAMVALTTLIHRGPGNCASTSEVDPNSEASASGTKGAQGIRPPRRVLFFDVKPLYRNPKTGQLEGGDRNLGDYDAEYQVKPFLICLRPDSSDSPCFSHLAHSRWLSLTAVCLSGARSLLAEPRGAVRPPDSAANQ